MNSFLEKRTRNPISEHWESIKRAKEIDAREKAESFFEMFLDLAGKKKVVDGEILHLFATELRDDMILALKESIETVVEGIVIELETEIEEEEKALKSKITESSSMKVEQKSAPNYKDYYISKPKTIKEKDILDYGYLVQDFTNEKLYSHFGVETRASKNKDGWLDVYAEAQHLDNIGWMHIGNIKKEDEGWSLKSSRGDYFGSGESRTRAIENLIGERIAKEKKESIPDAKPISEGSKPISEGSSSVGKNHQEAIESSLHSIYIEILGKERELRAQEESEKQALDKHARDEGGASKAEIAHKVHKVKKIQSELESIERKEEEISLEKRAIRTLINTTILSEMPIVAFLNVFSFERLWITQPDYIIKGGSAKQRKDYDNVEEAFALDALQRIPRLCLDGDNFYFSKNPFVYAVLRDSGFSMVAVETDEKTFISLKGKGILADFPKTIEEIFRATVKEDIAKGILAIKRVYDAFSVTKPPSKMHVVGDRIKRKWSAQAYTELYMIKSDETKRLLRYVVLLTDGRSVSFDGAIRILKPALWQEIKDESKGRQAQSLWNALSTRERELFFSSVDLLSLVSSSNTIDQELDILWSDMVDSGSIFALLPGFQEPFKREIYNRIQRFLMGEKEAYQVDFETFLEAQAKLEGKAEWIKRTELNLKYFREKAFHLYAIAVQSAFLENKIVPQHILNLFPDLERQAKPIDGSWCTYYLYLYDGKVGEDGVKKPFLIGDRVVFELKRIEPVETRHGFVSNIGSYGYAAMTHSRSTPISIMSIAGGEISSKDIEALNKKRQEEEVVSSYQPRTPRYEIRSDNGAFFRSEMHKNIRKEIDRPIGEVIPDPVYGSQSVHPQDLFQHIQKRRNDSQDAKQSARRARKPSVIEKHLKEASLYEQHADQAERTFERWRMKYPDQALLLVPDLVKIEEKSVLDVFTGASIIEGVHTKKGHKIFTVQLEDRVERDTFKEYKDIAKTLGGYYSSWRGAPTGFIFSTPEDANNFVMNVTGTRGEIDEETIEARRKDIIGEREKRFREYKANNFEKLAKKIKGDAEFLVDPAIGQLRPTRRRSRIATDMMERGEYQNYLGCVLTEISKRLRDNTIDPILAGVRFKTHVETLLTAGLDEIPSPTISTQSLKEILDNAEGLVKSGKRNLWVGFYRMNREKPFITIHSDEDVKDLRDMIKAIEEAGKIPKWQSSGYKSRFEDGLRAKAMGIETESQWQQAREAMFDLALGCLPDDLEAKEIQAKKEVREKETKVLGRKIVGYHPTPKFLIDEMLDRLTIKNDEVYHILEPSAGKGNIAEAIRGRFPNVKIDVIEKDSDLQDILVKKGFSLVNTDFLTEKTCYDIIVMNPPFENDMDIMHVYHAFELLKPGGELVAIMGESAFSGRSNFKKQWQNFTWNKEQKGDAENKAFERVKFNGTTVNVRLVHLKKTLYYYQKEGQTTPRAKRCLPPTPSRGATYNKKEWSSLITTIFSNRGDSSNYFDYMHYQKLFDDLDRYLKGWSGVDPKSDFERDSPKSLFTGVLSKIKWETEEIIEAKRKIKTPSLFCKYIKYTQKALKSYEKAIRLLLIKKPWMKNHSIEDAFSIIYPLYMEIPNITFYIMKQKFSQNKYVLTSKQKESQVRRIFHAENKKRARALLQNMIDELEAEKDRKFELEKKRVIFAKELGAHLESSPNADSYTLLNVQKWLKGWISTTMHKARLHRESGKIILKVLDEENEDNYVIDSIPVTEGTNDATRHLIKRAILAAKKLDVSKVKRSDPADHLYWAKRHAETETRRENPSSYQFAIGEKKLDWCTEIRRLSNGKEI